MRHGRGGPGDFERRYARAASIEPTPGSAEPLATLVAVLDHQRARAALPGVQAAAAQVRAQSEARRTSGHFPLLDLEAAVEPILTELEAAIGSLASSGGRLPPGLEEVRGRLRSLSVEERRRIVASWLEDATGPEPRLGFWVRVAAAPPLEVAAAAIEAPSKAEWSVPICPGCGGLPQVSVIGEQSGEFMAGSPRQLVCSRCALWWDFARATCVSCGEDDSRRLGSYSVEDERWARVDVCDTCRSYVKSFDLREPGGRDVVPLVDDVATLTLDLWAQEQGCGRPSLSFAGV